MANDDDETKYAVGYKKPPLYSRFKSGASGNPKGRKKNLVDLKEVFMRQLNQKVRIREGGQELRVSKQEALIISLINRAIKGENQAVRDVLALASRLIRLQDDEGNMDQLREEDLKILEGYSGQKGPFVDAIECAIKHDKEKVILIIDEINRANLANVLGPCF